MTAVLKQLASKEAQVECPPPSSEAGTIEGAGQLREYPFEAEIKLPTSVAESVRRPSRSRCDVVRRDFLKGRFAKEEEIEGDR